MVLGRFAKGVRESLSHGCHKRSLCLPGMGLRIYLSLLLRHKFSGGIATLSTGWEHRSGNGFQSIQAVEVLSQSQSLQLEVCKAQTVSWLSQVYKQ